jgi:hypothetical protein
VKSTTSVVSATNVHSKQTEYREPDRALRYVDR